MTRANPHIATELVQGLLMRKFGGTDVYSLLGPYAASVVMVTSIVGRPRPLARCFLGWHLSCVLCTRRPRRGRSWVRWLRSA